MEEKGFVYILYWHILIHKGAINLTEQKAAIRLLTQSSAKVWNYSEDSRNCHTLYIVSLRKSCLIISNLTPTYMFAPLELLRELIYPINRSVVAQLFSAAKRLPWFANNTHATDFLCSIELIYLICWFKFWWSFMYLFVLHNEVQNVG